jgi:hypothetical protein
VLEQFRIFRTALRLGQFTVEQLARESGVTEGTVQKTLRRRAELFITENGPPTKRRGGQPRVHTIRAELISDALQKAADAPEPPALPATQTGEPLGLALARDTLCRLLPRAASQERPILLSAASNHLDLIHQSGNAAAVGDVWSLHRSLSTLVDAQIWLVGLDSDVQESQSFRTLLSAIEAVLSAKERQERDGDLERRKRTAGILVTLPAEIAAFLRAAGGRLADKSDEPNWWVDVLAAIWWLLSSRFWQGVAGDLSGVELAAAATEREVAVLRPVPRVPGPSLPVRPAPFVPEERWAQVTLKELKGTTWKLGGAATDRFYRLGEERGGIRVRLESSDFAVYRGPESHGRIRPAIRGPIRPAISSYSRVVGRITALDLDLVSRQLSDAIVDDGNGLTAVVPYRELRLANPPEANDTRHVWIADRNIFADPDVGQPSSSIDIVGRSLATKLGSPQWVDYTTTRIVLKPGNRIEVFDAIDFRLRPGLGGDFESGRGKIGDVIAISIDLDLDLLTVASIKLVDRPELKFASFQELEYHPERQCFVLNSMDKTSVGGWSLTAGVTRGYTGIRRDVDYRSH